MWLAAGSWKGGSGTRSACMCFRIVFRPTANVLPAGIRDSTVGSPQHFRAPH
jgi:hypothetical protein